MAYGHVFGRKSVRESFSLQRVLNEQVAALYRDHHERICRFVRLFLGNAADSDEVVQEIYAKLLEGRATLPSPVSRSWLYRLVLNACRDHRRSWWSRVRRTSVDVSALQTLVDDRPTRETMLLDREKEAAFRRVLRQLPQRFRAAVILRDVEGLSYDEVAAALDCSVGTVSSRLSRGRKMLARKLGRGFK